MKMLPRLNGLSPATPVSKRIVPTTLLPAVFAILALCLAAIYAMPSHAKDKNTEQYRALYQQARDALTDNDTTRFNQIKRQLEDYVLYPYLEYSELSKNLYRTPDKGVRHFLKKYEDIPVASSLRYQWLNHLKNRNNWREFIKFYDPAIATTSQQCYYQWARYRKGEKTDAVNEAIKLWNVGKSQPKACDKLFAILTRMDLITEELAWERYTKAVLGHQFQLARYLRRFFTSYHYQVLAENFYASDRNPQLIGDYNRFEGYSDKQAEEVLAVIAHGVQHLARKDAPEAIKYWGHYAKSHPFDAATKSKTITALVKGLYQQGFEEVADSYIGNNKELIGSDLLEWRAREALAELDWTGLQTWIARMPEELQQDNRWRYWNNRAEQVINKKLSTQARETYEQLALTRSHYGFLSSDKLGRDYSMEHKDAITSGEALKLMQQDPYILRTRELLYHGEFVQARREWRKATKNFSEQQWITAAHLTRDWDWHHGSINSMISAAFWDDINLRFPLAHYSTFARHAKQTGVPVYLLMALARQESAMAHDITSPAGAKGLMQLMPATAKQTARKNAVPYKSSHDLFEPELNITLGSRYYSEMLERFDNNKILATAAYNAGPHRVDRWLKESDGKLPFDVWIEIIPFRETRGYVQNVLAFSMIYARHLNISTRMLRSDEMERLL